MAARTSGTDLGAYRYTAFGKTILDDADVPAPQILQPLQWKGRWHLNFGGVVDLYDMRARWWVPQIGTFLSVDEFAYFDLSTTLWGWAGQNPPPLL